MADFDAAAATYDRARHAMIPDYDVLYGTAVSALPFAVDAKISVLDLGCGTGGFANEIVNVFHGVQMMLSDVSGEMLGQARSKYGDDPRFSFVEQDCLTGNYGGPYDAVTSSLMIHHLEHADKQKVFGQVFAALKPGGVFVNIDQFDARSEGVREQLFARWRKDARRAGVTEADLAAGNERMKAFDHNAPMQDQFEWLEAAGFGDVDIIYRNYFWAVFVATKPG